MSEQSPAFQLYPRDLLADTSGLTDAAFGLYVRLLCRQWLDGSLPAAFESEEGESMIDCLPAGEIKERRRSFKSIARHFKPHPTEAGRVVQGRLERVRAEQAEFREKKARAGAIGGKHAQSKRRASTEQIPSDALNLLEAKSSPASAPASATANLAALGSGGAREDGDEIDRAELGPAVQLGKWFFAAGLDAGVVPAHLAVTPGPLGFALRYREPCEALLASYGPDEVHRRALNLFARKKLVGEGRVNVEATPKLLSEHWEWFDTAEPPRRREAVPVGNNGRGARTALG